MTSYNKPPTKLAIENAHPRDAFIEFDEGPHIYTVHGQKGYTSVTTWNHQHFSNFNADETINIMMKGKNWNDPSYKYYGMTPDEIKAMWNKKCVSASFSGTQMHYDIECYYNGMDVKNDSIEYSFFKKFVSDYPDLKPYRTEWMIYYEELKLSGSVDMIFENPDGTIQIYDWKRCQEISYENGFGKTAITKCINNLPDSNFWHYSLQLNVYKAILEAKYEKKVTGMFLVCMHPENPYKRYERIEVANLENEVKDLFELRKREIDGNVEQKH